MTISYLKRRKDQFLKDYEKYAGENITDKEFGKMALRVTKAVLNTFIDIVERENK